MYHCPVNICLVGFSDEIAQFVEAAAPRPSFSHHVGRTAEPGQPRPTPCSWT